MNVTLEELHLPYVTDAKNVKEFFDSALKYDEYAPMLAYIKEHGIPTKLWDRYLERFPYEIIIEFEDDQTVIDPNYGYNFSNGELFFSDDSIKVDSLARIKDIVFAWNVADTVYTGYFYFNEGEVLEYFDKAYGKKKGQKGVFVIKVSKYNDWFDICLRIGEQEFKFEKTRFLVLIIFIISCQCTANGIKLSVIQCEYEQTSMDDSENPEEKDIITYVGVFAVISMFYIIFAQPLNILIRSRHY